MNTETIIDACLAGKESGCQLLFETYYCFGKSICLRHTSSKEEAEEVLNDVFVKVFKNLSKYDREKPFKAWFRTIAVNTCIDFFRSKKQLLFDSIEENVQFKSHDEGILDRYGYEDLLEMVRLLPATFRTVFLLFAVEGYSHKEIAEKLNINEITSRTSLNKARAILQQYILDKPI